MSKDREALDVQNHFAFFRRDGRSVQYIPRLYSKEYLRISAAPSERETTRERKEYFFCAFSKQGNMGNGGREGREIGEGEKRNCVVRAWECVHESGLFPPVAITKAAKGRRKGKI